MNIRVRHHRLLYPFFRWYAQRRINKEFHTTNLIGSVVPKYAAILVISNHTTWWDGFWINHLNESCFKKRFTFLMRNDQLQKHWYFKYTGGIPIEKGSRSAVESLKFCSTLLNSPKYMLLIFPQGEIQSIHKSTFIFEKGTEWLLKNSPSNIQLIFAANLVDYFSNAKPTLNIYYEEYCATEKSILAIQSAYQNFYERSIEKQINLARP